MVLSFKAMTRGHSRQGQALRLKRALSSEPSREDLAAGAEVPQSCILEAHPMDAHDKAPSAQQPGMLVFRCGSHRGGKGAWARGLPVPKKLFGQVTGKHFQGGAASADVPQRPSRLSQHPHTLILVLLFASTKCGAFQKTSNFLCCYSVAIVN